MHGRMTESHMKAKKLILHVDDDQAMLDLVRKSLQKRGYDVLSIIDPRMALDALSEHSPRVVILDIDMPGFDGLTLLRDIKQRFNGIHVVLLTGMVSMVTVLEATGLGAQECVFKPLKNVNDVGDAVDRCFANIESWWDSLREWMERENASPTPAPFTSPAKLLLHAFARVLNT